MHPFDLCNLPFLSPAEVKEEIRGKKGKECTTLRNLKVERSHSVIIHQSHSFKGKYFLLLKTLDGTLSLSIIPFNRLLDHEIISPILCKPIS